MDTENKNKKVNKMNLEMFSNLYFLSDLPRPIAAQTDSCPFDGFRDIFEKAKKRNDRKQNDFFQSLFREKGYVFISRLLNFPTIF